jgi:putative membrane protein
VFAFALLQGLVLVATLALTSIRPVRLLLAPEPLKRQRVHRIAMQQFLSKGLQRTRGRTGVLILAAAEERHAEIIADEGIYAKVDKEVWADALAALAGGMKRGDPAAGFEEAVRLCGEVLAAHFPPDADNPNELPDTVVVI